MQRILQLDIVQLSTRVEGDDNPYFLFKSASVYKKYAFRSAGVAASVVFSFSRFSNVCIFHTRYHLAIAIGTLVVKVKKKAVRSQLHSRWTRQSFPCTTGMSP